MFSRFRHPSPTIEFVHPCQGANRCEACRKMESFEFDVPCTAEYLALRSEMNRNHDPIILKVPPELAAKIFEYCGPPGRDWRLVTGAVCREWRNLSWSSPNVWTSLSVRLGATTPWQPQLVKEWLDRSGSLPLTIEVYFYPDRWIGNPDKAISFDNVIPLIDILNLFSHRWMDLQLNGFPKEFHTLFKGNSMGASSLKSLTIAAVHSLNQDLTTGRFAIEAATPTPVHVDLSDIPLSAVNIAWHSLVSVKLAVANMDDVYQLFKTAPKIENFKLTLSGLWEDSDTLPRMNPRLTAVHLEELVIYSSHRVWPIEAFLESFAFPALTDLAIYGFETTDSEPRRLPFTAFESFLRYSGCQLKRLDFFQTIYTTSELCSFLEAVPSLEELKLHLPGEVGHDPTYKPDELIKRLSETASHDSGDAQPFLPCLRALSLNAHANYERKHYPNNKFPWELVSRLFGSLEDRKNANMRPLRDVELIFECRSAISLRDVTAIEEEIAWSLVHRRVQEGLGLYVHPWGREVDLLEDYQRRFGTAA